MRTTPPTFAGLRAPPRVRELIGLLEQRPKAELRFGRGWHQILADPRQQLDEVGRVVDGFVQEPWVGWSQHGNFSFGARRFAGSRNAVPDCLRCKAFTRRAASEALENLFFSLNIDGKAVKGEAQKTAPRGLRAPEPGGLGLRSFVGRAMVAPDESVHVAPW
jgi:hypothetical protein